MSEENQETLYDDDELGDENDYPYDIYDLQSMPNDFNITTIVDFVGKGVVKIPGFQRHYVWDIKRASKLIESILIGLPIPQIFLFERSKNNFLVIDGQQRLMTIFYFTKGRFPRYDKRAELRKIFANNNEIPEEILENDSYFEDFALSLKGPTPDKTNRFNGLKFATLGEYKSDFDLRVIRNVIVKAVGGTVKNDNYVDLAMYELFNRLNTGGVILGAQEVRMSLFHSSLMTELLKVNEMPEWRRVLGQPTQDIHMRDIEILVRALAVGAFSDAYKAPVAAFISTFCNNAQKLERDDKDVEKREKYIVVLKEFILNAAKLPDDSFRTKNKKLSILLFESVFHAICSSSLTSTNSLKQTLTSEYINRLKSNSEFQNLCSGKTTSNKFFKERLRIATEELKKVD